MQQKELLKSFVPLPKFPSPCPGISWPTPNRLLAAGDGAGYFAKHLGNADYGKPGWTRDEGRRFHKGIDIAPVKQQPTGQWIKVIYCANDSGQPWIGTEPVLEPLDPVFAVLDGEVVVANDCQTKSDYGKFVVLRHELRLPIPGKAVESFVTLYGHLAKLNVRQGQQVRSGHKLGTMGKTSRREEAKRWMDVAPHLHFEVGRVRDPLWAERPENRDAIGGIYNGLNLEPCDPLKFLRRFLLGVK